MTTVYNGMKVAKCCANCMYNCPGKKNRLDYCEDWIFSEEKFNGKE
jgi:hypothetical protein